MIPDNLPHMPLHTDIPVIDLFAGPGGLSEGFAAFTAPNGSQPFQIPLSIEKDARAHETLRFRAFYRQFKSRHVPEDYYRTLRQEITQDELFARYPMEAAAADREAWKAELGKTSLREVRQRIKSALRHRTPWVLLGGPPCQVYSLIGRSRQNNNPAFSSDERHRLYIEYLQALADFRPAIFIMENVKGLLSSTWENERIFERILSDLHAPLIALRRERRSVQRNAARFGKCRYRIYSLVCDHDLFGDSDRIDFIVRMENYGIPQARHRLILLGIREDISHEVPRTLEKSSRQIRVRDVLNGMPRLRSGLTGEIDTPQNWLQYVKSVSRSNWYPAIRGKYNGVASEIRQTLERINPPRKDRGGEFISATPRIAYRPDWFLDSRLSGYCNHHTRGHMASDLDRYLFAACFSRAEQVSPELADFPRELLPAHRNAKRALDGSLFADRFRVQLWYRPASTITSHISKDGHYYIHPDPTQCRSLTVREAARLQTFPDNYFFCGPRTAQYIQVGNAVPPLLANDIADIVYDVLKRSGVLD